MGVKRFRLRQPVAGERRYLAEIEIVYAGRELPGDIALNDALMTTGLFEEFDVTGKVLRVGPLDQVGRERPAPGG
jgi:hypothetical protein